MTTRYHTVYLYTVSVSIDINAFALRDSPSDYINATCWGSEDYIKRLHGSFKICDVGEEQCNDLSFICFIVRCFNLIVELQNGQILSKTSSELEDKWKPWTPRYANYNCHNAEISQLLLCS